MKTIAGALGVIENPAEPQLDTLKRVLAGREMLLVIDNFEHVIEAAPLIAELLVSAPDLKVLITSREALRLSGEQEYPVPPLSLPSSDSPNALVESERGPCSCSVRRCCCPILRSPTTTLRPSPKSVPAWMAYPWPSNWRQRAASCYRPRLCSPVWTAVWPP
jgi:hypothetical protein